MRAYTDVSRHGRRTQADSSVHSHASGLQDFRGHVLQWVLIHCGAIAVVFWILVALSAGLLVMFGTSAFGWDLQVYSNAIHSLALHRDPYADGTALQRVFHASPLADKPGIMPPYTYVYSPLTLPLLRAVGKLPVALSFGAYWALYAIGVGAIAWACLQLSEPGERAAFILIAPVTPFFPGMLQTDVILSGNLVYVLYGAALAAAVLGWRKGFWSPFYAAVLIASCFKAPLLTLVVLPLLSARKQWFPAAGTALSGLSLFALQPVLWPGLFHNYLDAVNLQFSFNHDFGFSPAGLLGNTLYFFHWPYSLASTAFYCVYATAVLLTLAYLARLYLRGAFPLERWAPVMLLGVVLLNPRVKEYDVAPLTLPLCMITWRLFSYRNTVKRAFLEVALFGFAVNAFVGDSSTFWKPTAGILLAGLFAGGAWQLIRSQSHLTPFLVQREGRLSP
jgi:hypothetical protein